MNRCTAGFDQKTRAVESLQGRLPQITHFTSGHGLATSHTTAGSKVVYFREGGARLVNLAPQNSF